MRVLVLCHGNVNRSPVAAAVLAKFPGLDVRSAGFLPGGLRVAKKTREAMTRRGYNLELHRSVQVNEEMVKWAEWIVTMDEGNRSKLHKKYGEVAMTKAIRLGHWADPPIPRISDPLYMQRGARFEAVIDLIIQCSKRLGNYLTEKECA